MFNRIKDKFDELNTGKTPARAPEKKSILSEEATPINYPYGSSREEEHVRNHRAALKKNRFNFEQKKFREDNDASEEDAISRYVKKQRTHLVRAAVEHFAHFRNKGVDTATAATTVYGSIVSALESDYRTDPSNTVERCFEHVFSLLPFYQYSNIETGKIEESASSRAILALQAVHLSTKDMLEKQAIASAAYSAQHHARIQTEAKQADVTVSASKAGQPTPLSTESLFAQERFPYSGSPAAVAPADTSMDKSVSAEKPLGVTLGFIR